LNTNGYFNALIDVLNKTISENFMREIHSKMWQTVTNAEEVLPAIFNAPQWNADDKVLAMVQ
jgi:predicted Rossmann-fold nucleotide-binding protein